MAHLPNEKQSVVLLLSLSIRALTLNYITTATCRTEFRRHRHRHAET